MGMLDRLLEFQKPEATTIIRWLLRVILVVFLAWLVRRKPEEEEEDEVDEDDKNPRRTNSGNVRPRQAVGRDANGRTIARLQPRARENAYPASSTVRQRRPQGDAVDFDSVINKMSKPKDMWQVRKNGEGPLILRSDRSQDLDDNGSTATGSRGLSSGVASDGAAGSASGSGRAAGRQPLNLQAPKAAAVKENSLHGHERPVTCVTWNRDCNLIFTCGKDKIVCVWSFPEGDQLGSYVGHQGAVWASSVTVDSRWLVSSGADRLVIVWEARTSRELARIELPGVVRFVEWAGGGSAEPPSNPPASERFVACYNKFGSKPPALGVYTFDSSEESPTDAIKEVLIIDKLPTAASIVKWGRGDEFVVSCHDSGELCFWRADTGEEFRRLKAHDASISKFDFSSDRELVATASSDKSVRVWDLGEGSEWRMIYSADTDRPLNAVALGPMKRSDFVGAPDERPGRCSVIAAGGQDARDVTTCSSTTEQFGTLMFKLGTAETLPCELQADGVTKGHFGPVHTLAFARNGAAIASGSEDGCVRLHLFEPRGATPKEAGAAAS